MAKKIKGNEEMVVTMEGNVEVNKNLEGKNIESIEDVSIEEVKELCEQLGLDGLALTQEGNEEKETQEGDDEEVEETQDQDQDQDKDGVEEEVKEENNDNQEDNKNEDDKDKDKDKDEKVKDNEGDDDKQEEVKEEKEEIKEEQPKKKKSELVKRLYMEYDFGEQDYSKFGRINLAYSQYYMDDDDKRVELDKHVINDANNEQIEKFIMDVMEGVHDEILEFKGKDDEGVTLIYRSEVENPNPKPKRKRSSKTTSTPRIKQEVLDELVGKEFHMLKVEKYLGHYKKDGWRDAKHWYRCKCECGGSVDATRYSILKERIKSCGCLRKGSKKRELSDEEKIVNRNKIDKGKAIMVIDTNNDNKVSIFDDRMLCARDLDLKPHIILEVLKGKKGSYKGYKFLYK